MWCRLSLAQHAADQRTKMRHAGTDTVRRDWFSRPPVSVHHSWFGNAMSTSIVRARGSGAAVGFMPAMASNSMAATLLRSSRASRSRHRIAARRIPVADMHQRDAGMRTDAPCRGMQPRRRCPGRMASLRAIACFVSKKSRSRIRHCGWHAFCTAHRDVQGWTSR